MAADAAVSSTVKILGNLLIQKVNFLRGVDEQVRWLKDELKRMQCFLKDAAKKQADHESMRNWIAEIRDVAYDAEDAIEMFVLRVERRGLLGRLATYMYYLNEVGKEIESIKKRIKAIDEGRERYKIKDLGEGLVDSSRIRPKDVERLRRLSPSEEDKHLVGIKEDVELLLKKLILEEKRGLSVAAIVGMGGIGKSTLAKKIYNDAAIAAEFECHAWVVVSSEFAAEDIIKEIMLQLNIPLPDDKLKVLQSIDDSLRREKMLQEMLHKHLVDKQYFIVLDDVWEQTHWESLRSAFPAEQDKASRLLLTSRCQQIISKDDGYIHKMRLLDDGERWELLLKTAFPGKTDPEECPQELKSIGQEILNKCQGLPLAINAAGGLLVNHKGSKIGWEEVLKEMNTHLDRNGSPKDTVSTILELSYKNLPSELKPCFLCLGFFKEDATIRAKRLIHIWVAQGFVLQEGGDTIEEIARGYLDEMINRNLVQVMDIGKDDRLRTIQVHDLIRDLSIRLAKENISFEILKDKAGNSSQSSQKSRHRALYCSQGRLIGSTNQDKLLRSLFVHVVGKFVVVCPSSSYWKSFKLLKVLDLERCRLEILPKAIGDLIGLKYLGLRYTRISKLPSSLGRLINLQVLDLQWNNMVKVPDVIWKMCSLRHLYVHSISHTSSGGRLKIGTLKNIQTLTYIQLEDWMEVKQPKEMASLQKLGIVIDLVLDSEVSNKLFTSLAMLEKLVCLNLRMKWALNNMDGLGTLQHITQLKLRGNMTRLPGIFPPNLSRLSLIIYNQLEEDPMPVLAKLPNLLYLKLNYKDLGKKMVIADGGFPKLKVLSLEKIWVLESIHVGEGPMPELKQLKISNCPKLDAAALPERLRSAAIFTGIN